jgi:hypothetical protein
MPVARRSGVMPIRLTQQSPTCCARGSGCSNHGATRFPRILAEFQSRFSAQDDCRRTSSNVAGWTTKCSMQLSQADRH